VLILFALKGEAEMNSLIRSF